jgi:hypothetical protein
MNDYTATYSPEDNKLRLYTVGRLDAATYSKLKDAGFKWAPQQKLFFAPAWSPAREDALLELAGEIGDEDTSLVARAEERSDRFDTYADHRERDAVAAEKGVHAIADGIPLGQPILVGHHSERHARKDAERIENGMRKAVKMWETSAYWLNRAAGAVANAKYKERPDVRARRIKGLEADLRKMERNRAESELCRMFWAGELKLKSGEPFVLTRERALNHCNVKEHLYFSFPLAKYPRNPPASQYEGEMSLWSALGGSDGPECAIITPEQARDRALPIHERYLKTCARWISHYENRLAYERAMLAESGYKEPEKVKREILPLLNYKAKSVAVKSPYLSHGETLTLSFVEMTKAEYAKYHDDYKCTRIVNGTHRVRLVMKEHSLWAVYLTDSKTHEIPKEEP